MQEKDIEKKLRIGIKGIGGLCLKWVSPGYTGVPDRMILLPGGIIRFAELKAPGKDRTKTPNSCTAHITPHGLYCV